MPNLKPFRDYDEHDVINLFGFQHLSQSNEIEVHNGQEFVGAAMHVDQALVHYLESCVLQDWQRHVGLTPFKVLFDLFDYPI